MDIVKNVDGKFIVTGVDPELLEQALKALIPQKPNDPVGMKQGLVFYGYKGHWIVCDTTTGQLHWEIQAINRSKLPTPMDGRFTSQTLAQKAVDNHAKQSTIDEGVAILERKQTKLAQDKANGTKVKMPDEQEKLQVRAFEETLKLVKKEAKDPSRDKPTVME